MIEKKLLLSELRGGDFTHPSDVEAIKFVMDKLERNFNVKILDVGCGLGGTANYLYQHGWHHITGIDNDPKAINHAKAHYPDIQFIETDVNHCAGILNEIFDFIYAFSAYFSFAEQTKALLALNKIAKAKATLMLFDYACNAKYHDCNPFDGYSNRPFHAINLDTINAELNQTGWKEIERKNITSLHLNCYQEILAKMEKNRNQLTKTYGLAPYESVYDSFAILVDCIEKKKLFGVVIYAENQS